MTLFERFRDSEDFQLVCDEIKCKTHYVPDSSTGSPRNSRLIRRRRSSRIAKNRELRNTLISHNFQSEITENYIVKKCS